MSNSNHMIIKVARDCDLFEQVGRDIYFDLVDHDKVLAFSIRRTYPFSQFKEDIAEEYGIPVQFQRFWKWTKRKNHTRRPHRPLTPEEESEPVGDLTEARELELFLEVELGSDHRPVSPPVKGDNDIMLFFKLYDPEKGSLRYVGRLFVDCYAKPRSIVRKLNEMAGFDPNEAIDIYEELKFNPVIECDLIDRALSFKKLEIQDGDIICFQKTTDQFAESCRYPSIPSFLEHIRACKEMEANHPSDRFTWKISNFSKLTSKKYYSEVFTVAGCKWEVLIYPKGDRADHLSIFLCVADHTSLPTGWSRSVDFSLTVVDQKSRDSSIEKDTSKKFNGVEFEGGFTGFMSLTELHDQTKGYLVQDTLVVEAYVNVLKAAPPVFASDSTRDTARFVSFFDSLDEVLDDAETSACVEMPSSRTQTTQAAPVCPSSEEVEGAKQFLKECLSDDFNLNMKERLASALSTLTVAQKGLSCEQRKSILEFWGHFDEFISDYLTLEQEISEHETLKVQNALLVSSMKMNHGSHLFYKQMLEKLAREKEELQKMLEETRCREAQLMSDWGTLLAKTEEAKSNYVSKKPKIAEVEERKRMAEERVSRSRIAWSSLKAHFV